ncbi:MAG TPA: GIY-YIG nuclease family protein [Candidatus Krumholzibacteria bacterium]|nr:GIY-YIG nuclease family protein [Candidatus Krumholzibacteria bacterium]
MSLLEILKLRGFDPSIPGRLVRHQDDRFPVEVLRRHAWFDLYQRYQRRPVFYRCGQIVAFYGLPGTRAAFHGVYRVNGVHPASDGEVLPECPWSREWHEIANHYYDLERDSRFDEFRDRLIIDWGKSTRAWVQTLRRDKPILEILAPGRTLPPFDDYLEFSLTFAELRDLFANEDAHREWRARLSAVGGVYLILAETTGDLYVGSASGESGVWGRWREYAKTGHGGNALLKGVIRGDREYPERFRFSILQILPKTMARDEIIKREALYKDKLGSRATGLNLN